MDVAFHLSSELLHSLFNQQSMGETQFTEYIKEKEEREKFGQGFWSALTLTSDRVLYTGIFSTRVIFALQTVLPRLEFA